MNPFDFPSTPPQEPARAAPEPANPFDSPVHQQQSDSPDHLTAAPYQPPVSNPFDQMNSAAAPSSSTVQPSLESSRSSPAAPFATPSPSPSFAPSHTAPSPSHVAEWQHRFSEPSGGPVSSTIRVRAAR